MNDDILNYYERELTYIREMGAEFAGKYPKIAGRLLLEPDKCEDPHTERLIEAFSLLSGRIHKKIDDAFPEITEALLNIIYPHYVNPIPSMAIARFVAANMVSPSGYRIEKATPLYSKPIGGTPCQFTTAYPVTLWPVQVVSAQLQDPKKLFADAQQAIVIRLKTFNDLGFSELDWKNIRFYLNGPAQHVFHLYELLLNNVCHVECEWLDQSGRQGMISLNPSDIAPIGFHPDETLVPHTRRSFPGYLSLLEYFSFPEKFLFIDINGLDRLGTRGLHNNLEITIYLNRAAKSNLVVNGDTFCLNATPVIKPLQVRGGADTCGAAKDGIPRRSRHEEDRCHGDILRRPCHFFISAYRRQTCRLSALLLHQAPPRRRRRRRRKSVLVHGAETVGSKRR